MDLTTRVNLVRNLLKTKELPVKTGAALLDINRTSVYYKGTPISQEELDCKSIIDRLHTDNPVWRARQLSAQLKKRGYQVDRRKTRRYMNEMGIDPIYPKMNLSKRMQQAKVCPYLLRNAVIDRPNQAWSIDITYIPIKRGFLYLTQYNNIREARKAIGKYVHTYNFERCYSALNNQTPASCYYPILLLDNHAA